MNTLIVLVVTLLALFALTSAMPQWGPGPYYGGYNGGGGGSPVVIAQQSSGGGGLLG